MTREEAIKAIKAWDFLDKDEKEVLETLIPELAESEDDRIRKALMRYHQSTLNIDGIKGEEILAWLEKQGKREPTDLDVLNYIRKETCCGLAEANNALLELIKVLKEHPSCIMDKSHKLKIEWEEQ